MATNPSAKFGTMRGRSPEEAKFFWTGGPIEVAPRTWFASQFSGCVAFETDDGLVLTENAAILQYVAERFPDAGLGAGAGIERSRLHQWLCFIGTELHKGLFVTLLDRKAPADVHAYTLAKGLSRLDYLNTYLEGREFLLDHFSVADAYLGTVLNWTMATPPIDLKKWPAINDYLNRFKTRPSVTKALAEEFELYKAEVARHKAAA